MDRKDTSHKSEKSQKSKVTISRKQRPQLTLHVEKADTTSFKRTKLILCLNVNNLYSKSVCYSVLSKALD